MSKGRVLLIEDEPDVAEAIAWQLDKVLQQYGLTILDVDRVIIPFPDMPAALSNGSVDAAMVIDPWLTRAVREGIAARLVTRTVPLAMTTSMIASGKLVQERPDVARRWMIAMMRSVRESGGAAKPRSPRWDECRRVITCKTAWFHGQSFRRCSLGSVSSRLAAAFESPMYSTPATAICIR